MVTIIPQRERERKYANISKKYYNLSVLFIIFIVNETASTIDHFIQIFFLNLLFNLTRMHFIFVIN